MDELTGTNTTAPDKHGSWAWFKDQFSLLPLVGEYYIPEETNNFWYSMGGVLALALVVQIITGTVLMLKYVPDAGLAYGIVSDMLHSPYWGPLVSFHYFNSFLIFGLLFLHIMRVFISGAYRNGKKGLWLIGVFLAVVTFGAYVTGESLHWDEVGFAVPWHISEIFQATHVDKILHYSFSDLKDIPSATTKLVQIYGVHVATFPLLILLLMIVHFYLIKMKGISMPFWKRSSGKRSNFGKHIKMWFLYGTLMMGAVLLISIFAGRDAGTSPQLLPSSPLYQATHGPGGLGYKPTFPISWTHGWNVFVNKRFGLEPDIWGTAIAMVLMLGSLILIPFVDRESKEPVTWKEVFDLRKRGWAFLLIAIFWSVMIIGVIQNAIAGPG